MLNCETTVPTPAMVQTPFNMYIHSVSHQTLPDHWDYRNVSEMLQPYRQSNARVVNIHQQNIKQCNATVLPHNTISIGHDKYSIYTAKVEKL
jgi:hypothetical protein